MNVAYFWSKQKVAVNSRNFDENSKVVRNVLETYVKHNMLNICVKNLLRKRLFLLWQVTKVFTTASKFTAPNYLEK